MVKKQEQRIAKKSTEPEKARNAKRTSLKTTNNDKQTSLSDLYEERADGIGEPAPEKKSFAAKRSKSVKTAKRTSGSSARPKNEAKERKAIKGKNDGEKAGKTNAEKPKNAGKTQTVQNAAKAEKTKRTAKPANKKTSVPKKPATKKRTDGVGVTENAPYSHLADYRMITTADDVASSSGS